MSDPVASSCFAGLRQSIGVGDVNNYFFCFFLFPAFRSSCSGYRSWDVVKNCCGTRGNAKLPRLIRIIDTWLVVFFRRPERYAFLTLPILLLNPSLKSKRDIKVRKVMEYPENKLTALCG